MGEHLKVCENVLELIGKTPMIKLQRIPKDHGLECEIYAKCEFLNPGGSIKDRIAKDMVLDAERNGNVTKNPLSTFVEPTSGNTGIGMSLVAAVQGYGAIIVTPDKNSDEKMNTMTLLGTKIVQTPAAAFFGSPENFLAVTQKILSEVPNTHSCDQYVNPVNPSTHYDDTAEEILAQVPDLDMVVMGAGTGGTVAGVGKKMKEKRPQCTVVAVDPQGSTMFRMNDKPKVFFVEGIGGDFIPNVLDKSSIDEVVITDDKQSFNMAREIIRKEGLLCGGSSGAAVYGAIQAAKMKKLGPGAKVVVILPDGIRNYMTKFVSDQWMESHLFKEPPLRNFGWYQQSVQSLPLKFVPSVEEHQSAMQAFQAMGSKYDVAFVVNDKGGLKGVVSKDSLRFKATNPLKEEGANFDDEVTKFVVKHYHKIVENIGNPTVGLASRILDIAPFVVIGEMRNDQLLPKGIITANIVLDFIIQYTREI